MGVQQWMRTSGSAAVVGLVIALLGNTAVAQGNGQLEFTLPIQAVSCDEPPADNPETPCGPTVGATFDVTSQGGEPLDSCTTEEATLEGGVVGFCSVEVPFETTVIITENVATIPDGYVPVENPITFQIPAVKTDPTIINFYNVPQDDNDYTNGLVEALVEELVEILRKILE